MRGAYYVAIALLIVASCSAAKFDQTEPKKVPNNGFVTSGGTVDKMLPKRVLRGSRDLKNKWAVHAGGEDRMLNRFSNENNLLEGIDQTITKAANVMGTNRDDVIVKAAEAMTNYKQLNPTSNIINSKQQPIKPRPINVYRQALLHATPNPKKAVVAVPNDVPFVLANRLEREKSTNTVNYAGRPITQHDYLPASLSFPSTSAVAPDGQFNKQLITQKALEFDLIKRPDEVKARSSKRQRTNPMLNNMDGGKLHARPNLEEPLAPVANNMPFVWATKLGRSEPIVTVNNVRPTTQHDYRRAPSVSSPTIAAAPNGRRNKQPVVQKAIKTGTDKRPGEVMIKNSKRPRIDATLKNVDGKELYATPNAEKNLGPVANNAPFALAKRPGRDKPIVTANDAVGPMKKTQHGNRLPLPGFSTTSAVASGSRHEKHRIAQKALKIDKKKHLDEVEIKDKQRQRIDPTLDNVDGEEVHAPPTPEKSLVVVGSNAAFVLASRLRKEKPTVIMLNAVRCLMEHNYRPKIPDSLSTSVVSPDSPLSNQLIADKVLKFDLNKLPDEVDLHSVEDPLHLREENAHSTALDRQSVTDDYNVRMRVIDKVSEEEKKVHEAFVKALNLPFHQYLQETATMIRLLKWKDNSSPNARHVYRSLKSLANLQKKDTKQLLKPDLAKLLGVGKYAVTASRMNLEEAYIVKLMIMYELFYDFCHSNKGLVEELPLKRKRRHWILELLI